MVVIEVYSVLAETITIMVAEAAMVAVSALAPVETLEESADNTVMSVAAGTAGEQSVHSVQRHVMNVCPSRQKRVPLG
jgi:hypothetical protein